MADSDVIKLMDNVIDVEPVQLATGAETDGAPDRSVGAEEQEHTEDTGREAVNDRTLELAYTTKITVATAETIAGTGTTEEVQETLVPQDLPTGVVAIPPALAADGELVRDGAPDTTDTERISADIGLMSVTSKDGPEDLPIKEYLDATVVPVLRDGLRILAKERPEDPYTFLGDYIKAHREAP